jgi:hypothetical protein
MATDPLEEAAVQLYGLPLEDFTRERDANARELRAGGRRDAAAEVAKLQKPTQVAWAVNRLAREERALMDALMEAGQELRSAQEHAVGGGDAGALRAAAAAERRAVDALVEAAAGVRPAGRAMSRSSLDRVRETLHAAAADEDLRARVAAGRLVKEAAGGGGWPLTAAAGAPAARENTPTQAAQEPTKVSRAKTPTQAAQRPARVSRAKTDDPTPKAQERTRKAQERDRRQQERAREREAARLRREEAERSAAERRELLAALKQARKRAAAAGRDLEAAQEADEAARDEVARLEERLG